MLVRNEKACPRLGPFQGFAALLGVMVVFACTPHPVVDTPTSPSSSMSRDTSATPSPIAGPLIPATDHRIALMGRALAVDLTATTEVARNTSDTVAAATKRNDALRFGFPGVTLRFCFRGTQLGLVGSSSGGRSRLRVRIDGQTVKDVVLPQAESELHLWTASSGSGEHGASEDSTSDQAVPKHCAEIIHLTETWLGVVTLSGIRTDGELEPPPALPERRLLFIGDSVTCGEAVVRRPGCQKNETWWDPTQSYGALTATALNAQYQLVCFGGKGVVRDWQGKSDVLNAPQFFPLIIPDETTNARWDMSHYVPDAVVISLGTNDFHLLLGPFPEREHFLTTYVGLVGDVLAAFPSTKVFLTEGAIVSDNEPGAPQKTTLRDYLQEVVRRLNSAQVTFVPANHYPGDTCDQHPTAEQHAAMAADLAPVVADRMGWVR